MGFPKETAPASVRKLALKVMGRSAGGTSDACCGPGGDRNFPSIEQLFVDRVVPGIDTQPNFLHSTFFTDIDYLLGVCRRCHTLIHQNKLTVTARGGQQFATETAQSQTNAWILWNACSGYVVLVVTMKSLKVPIAPCPNSRSDSGIETRRVGASGCWNG